MADIYVAVHDGDFTAWLIAEGHAYPFGDVEGALGALPDITSDPNAYLSDDDHFRESVEQEDVWWDRCPDPVDGEAVAALLKPRR